MMQTAANLDFRYPTVEDAAWRRRCSAPRAGWDEYSFTTMFMWRSLYHNRLARWGDTLFISAGRSPRFICRPSALPWPTGSGFCWNGRPDRNAP